MIGQAKVVVGAEVQHPPAVDDHPCIRGRAHCAQGDQQITLAQGVHIRADEVQFVSRHYVISYRSVTILLR